MNSEELYDKLEDYFPKHLDLMRHLDVGACWKYVIKEASIDNGETKLIYYLYKEEENNLVMTKKNPEIEPDLILYFTEKAILNLIENNPNAEEYYAQYREVMNNPQPEIAIDNKINKSRLLLWRLGYKNWQKDFNF